MVCNDPQLFAQWINFPTVAYKKNQSVTEIILFYM